MPSIKWHYLPLSYFPLSRSCVSDMQCSDTGQSREANQHIYIMWQMGRNDDDYGTMILALEDWLICWGFFHVTWVRVSPLSSSPGADLFYSEQALVIKCCPVNWFLSGMLLSTPCKDIFLRKCCDLYLFKDLLCCNNWILSGNLASLQETSLSTRCIMSSVLYVMKGTRKDEIKWDTFWIASFVRFHFSEHICCFRFWISKWFSGTSCSTALQSSFSSKLFLQSYRNAES